MKKLKPVLVLLAIFISAASFITSKEWYLIDAKTYSVEFPVKPTNEVQSVPSEIGELKMDINMYDASKEKKEENLVYCLMITEYPDSLINSDKKEMLPSFFRNSTDGAVKNVGGKLLSEKNITLGEFPGYEIRIDFKDGLAVIKMRSYLVHNKMYVLQTIAETAKEKNASSLRFLDSFKLKK